MHKKCFGGGIYCWLVITPSTKSKVKTTSNDYIIPPGWTVPISVSRKKFDWWRWYTVVMRMMIVDKVCKEGAKFTRPARPMRSIGVPGVSYSTSLDQGSLTCSLFWSISISWGPLLKKSGAWLLYLLEAVIALIYWPACNMGKPCFYFLFTPYDKR